MNSRLPLSDETISLAIPQTVAQHIQDEIQLLQERLAKVSRQIEKEAAFSSIIIFHKGIQRHIRIEDILMIRSESNYSRFYLATDQEILSCRTLKYWHKEITHPDIRRTHASYMINTRHIVHVDKKQNRIRLTNGYQVKISRRYRALF